MHRRSRVIQFARKEPIPAAGTRRPYPDRRPGAISRYPMHTKKILTIYSSLTTHIVVAIAAETYRDLENDATTYDNIKDCAGRGACRTSEL